MSEQRETMKDELLDTLACPGCRARLSITDRQYHDGEIASGSLLCQKCGGEYPIIRGVPRFVRSDGYADSFSLEWAKHARTQLGFAVADAIFRERTGFTEDDIRGKLVLDAGCGIGRFMDVVQLHGGRTVGVDMSFSVDQAYLNVGKHSAVNIVQADIMHPPFRYNSFDIVFSIGVLHHTEDAGKAFGKLAELVKDGGKLAVWVYPAEGRARVPNAMSALYRLLTTRMPRQLLYRLCYIAVPLYYVYSIPLLGHASRLLLPISMEHSAAGRILDTFDWYSPRYQSKHTVSEVRCWFEQAGFSEIRRLPSWGVAMVGMKEAEAESCIQ